MPSSKVIIFILSIVILSLLIVGGAYLYKTFKSIPKNNTSQQSSTLPVPLNHPAVNNAVVLYFFDGRIEKIASDSSSPNKKLILVSHSGTRFPYTVSVSDSFIINTTDIKGEIVGQSPASTLREGSSINMDIRYNPKTYEFTPNMIKLKP